MFRDGSSVDFPILPQCWESDPPECTPQHIWAKCGKRSGEEASESSLSFSVTFQCHGHGHPRKPNGIYSLTYARRSSSQQKVLLLVPWSHSSVIICKKLMSRKFMVCITVISPLAYNYMGSFVGKKWCLDSPNLLQLKENGQTSKQQTQHPDTNPTVPRNILQLAKREKNPWESYARTAFNTKHWWKPCPPQL